MLENISGEEIRNGLIIFYIIYSILGFFFMVDYIGRCKKSEVVPFNNSPLKGFLMLLACGLFTKLALVVGIISSLFDIFKKKG